MEKNIYSSFKCEICSQKQNSHLDNNIFNYCKNCKKIICNNCINQHKKDNNNHNFVKTRELNIKCLEHNNDIIAYCLDCQEQLCTECLKNTFHFDHKKTILTEMQLSNKEKEVYDKIINILKEEKKKIENEQKDNFDGLCVVKDLSNQILHQDCIFIYGHIYPDRQVFYCKILVDEKNQIEKTYDSQVKENNKKLVYELEKNKNELEIKLKELELKYKKEEHEICEKYARLNNEEEILKNEKINLSQIKYEQKIEQLKIKNNLDILESQITINEIFKTSYEKYPNNYNNYSNIINIMASYYKSKNELFNNIFIDNNLINKLEEKGKINQKIIEEEDKKKENLLNEIYAKLNEEYYVSSFKKEDEVKEKIKELNYDEDKIIDWVESIM